MRRLHYGKAYMLLLVFIIDAYIYLCMDLWRTHPPLPSILCKREGREDWSSFLSAFVYPYHAAGGVVGLLMHQLYIKGFVKPF